MARADAFVALAETTRSGFSESIHFGALVALERDGSIAFSLGDPLVDIYPRSSTKPMQAIAMVRSGLDLPPDLLALVCASHDGTPGHLDGVRRILASAGLDESALRNTPDLPLEEQARERLLNDGGRRSSVQQNCSGKHAGMLATCVINGWSLDDYIDPVHPLQLVIDDVIPTLTGEPLGHVGIDGCGAPAHVMSLVGLARAFRVIAAAPSGSDTAAVATAMSSYPAMVGGDARDITRFMRLVPGMVAKDGAEAVFAAALPDGRAIALKVSDGNYRACPSIAVEALRLLDIDVTVLAESVREPIMGHGREVGEVRVLPDAFGGH